MPQLLSRLALLAGLAALGCGCQPQPTGTVQVAIIGPTPRIVDPATAPVRPGDALLLSNVAQGLVRFDARGQIEPGLAERWNVSDDGLSYIFRLPVAAEWPDGRRISAHQVARLLRRQLNTSSRNPLKEALGTVGEVVAMTDRVIEIRLAAPRPHLLQLLAQPELALIREGLGTGPFTLVDERGPAGELRLQRQVADEDEEEERREELWLRGVEAEAAVRSFAAGTLDLALGGTFADLPVARAVRLKRGSLRFDPVAGLFGLVPTRADGPLAIPELRRLLSEAIDRDALLAAFAVPGLAGRATVLEPRLDGLPDLPPPPWTATPIGERRPALMALADTMFGDTERPVIRVALPEGPGARLLLARLAADWGLLGLRVEAAGPGRPADLELIDAVAPSTSRAWFLRRFHCDSAPVCNPQVDELLAAARATPVNAQRGALLAEAARLIEAEQLFLPIAAPIRWALVSDRIEGFATNRFGRHMLTGLEQNLGREGAE